MEGVIGYEMTSRIEWGGSALKPRLASSVVQALFSKFKASDFPSG